MVASKKAAILAPAVQTNPPPAVTTSSDMRRTPSSGPLAGPAARPDFRADLAQVTRQIRSSLSALLLEAGLDPLDPQALVKRWGLNRQLSWKIAKLIQSADAYSMSQHLPGPQGMDILFARAEHMGVTGITLDTARRALQGLDQLIETHCGERAVFDIMASACSSGDSALQHQEALRRQFFMGASAIWGARTRVNLVTWFVAPSANDASKADMVSLKGWIGFSRLREQLSWVVSRHMSRHDDGRYMAIPMPEALDPASDWTLPLMREFGSDPPPDFSVAEDNGRLTVALAPGPTGLTGQLSCVFGKLHRGLPHARTESDRLSRFICDLSVPSELVVFDLFVHESLDYAMPPEVMLSSLIEPREPGLERSRLPLHEKLEALGPASEPPLTLEVPRYHDMLARVFERTGWAANEFHGFRLKMAYPPMPAVLSMSYELR